MSTLQPVDPPDPVNIWLWETSERHEYDEIPDSSAIRRHLLASTYGGAISDWSVGCSDLGKPIVTCSASSQNIRISAARTGNVEVFACSHHGALGVDIETLSHSTDRLHYVSRTFAPKEQDFLAQQADKNLAIINLWTLKESYGKAMGVGMDFSQEEHCFDLSDRSRPQLYSENTPSWDGEKWQFHNAAPRSDLRLAIAIQSENHRPIPVRMQWIETNNILLPPKLTVRSDTGIHSC